MAFDLKKFLDDLGVAGDDRAVVERALAPKADVIAAGYLRQEDYSAKMNEVTNLRSQIEAKDAQLTAEATEWATLTAAEKAASGDLRASIEALEADKLRLTQRLTRVAGEAGLDVKTVMDGLETEVVTKSTPPAAAIDTTKFATADSIQALNHALGAAFDLPAVLQDLAAEHQELFGSRLQTTSIMAEIKKRAATPRNQKSLDPRVVWEEMNNVSAKREEVSKTKYEADLRAAEDRGRQAAITEMAVPGGHTVRTGHASPVLVGARESKLQRTQPGSGVQSAVAAFSSGKYRQQGAAKTA